MDERWLSGSTRTDAAGGQSRGKQIGQAVAMIALVVASAVFAAPLAGLIGPAAATVAQAAIPAGPGYLLRRGR
jgi:hypothetical protein